MKRLFDFSLAIALLILLFLPFLLVSCMVKFTSSGPVLYWSKRVGKDNHLFLMPKFRSMKIDTPQVATHLLIDPRLWLTPIGGFIRNSSLDEIPQLWCILMGEMSFVGPRPALFNQEDLINLRNEYNIQYIKPGLTGWAQINGRDELTIQEKVAFDYEYYNKRSFFFDLKIIWLTILNVVTGKGVSH